MDQTLSDTFQFKCYSKKNENKIQQNIKQLSPQVEGLEKAHKKIGKIVFTV